jgi:hypothetical protein
MRLTEEQFNLFDSFDFTSADVGAPVGDRVGGAAVSAAVSAAVGGAAVGGGGNPACFTTRQHSRVLYYSVYLLYYLTCRTCIRSAYCSRRFCPTPPPFFSRKKNPSLVLGAYPTKPR